MVYQDWGATQAAMDKPPPDVPPRPNDGRLDSWKKIAVYLKRDVTTVQRWEKREGMPVHRHLHDKTGSVYAFRAELDAWSRSRREPQPLSGAGPVPEESAPLPPPGTGSISRARTTGLLIAGIGIIAVATIIWMERTDHFWRNPITGAVYQSLTGFDGQNEAAAVSRDGQFVAFLSDRGGRTDVWVTQIGSGQFHNLTRGIEGELVNPAVRTLDFSPDGSAVLFWLRNRSRPPGEDISIWSVPTLGGEPTLYLEGAAESAWSPDGKQIAYHTPGPGDPLFITDGKDHSHTRPVLQAPPGLHSHFPLWAPANLIYFIKGSLPDQLDVWRVRLGGEPERITSHSTHLTYPVLLDPRTLLYLANSPDGSGPWIYGMDVERRVPHRLTLGVEQYTSLAASADGHRVIATVSETERTLWRVAISAASASQVSRGEASRDEASPARIALSTGSGFAPRFGPNYLLYVAAAGTGDSIWKISGAAAVQLWTGTDARVIGAPAISADGQLIGFSVSQRGQRRLYCMGSDGSRIRIVSDSLALQGAPSFAPDGRSITTAAEENGAPHLLRIPLDGGAPLPLVDVYSVDPTWSPDGRFVVYSGPDVGIKFSVNATTAQHAPYPLPQLTLTRGARHLALRKGGRRLVFLQGEIQHKNLWMVDLDTGVTQQLTYLPAGFDVRDFDISPDGGEALLERAQARSDVVMIDRSSQE